jgi:xanthine dehydrogenase accessory factor
MAGPSMAHPSTVERVAGLERELEASRAPFVHATVVRAEAPTSARPGDVALIRGDGSVEGFVGGHCARGTVQVAALETLRTGESVLLRILPDDSESFPDVDGARVAVNPCLSGGALEVFLRPHLPPPLVAVVGTSPIADALAEVAGAAGYAVSREAGAPGQVPPGASAVVLAGHTGDEGPAVRAALDAGVGYVGLVASPKRAAAVLDEISLSDAERERVRSPAGLWLGARTPGEIAVSILAEIVQEVRLRDLAPVAGVVEAAGIPEAPREVLDPVCGMTVIVGPETPHAVVDGEDVWFCGPGCRDHHVSQAGV